jgi:hemerythrin-like domain-containing protein
MEAHNTRNPNSAELYVNKRREFLKKGIIIGALTGITGVRLFSGCKEETDEKISPAEDLMREHGILNRIMLVYDACKIHLINNEQFSFNIMNDSAQVIRNFIEEYHEKLEENFLFPRFEKANILTDLVRVLRTQHQAGRKITDQIIEFSKKKSSDNQEDNKKIVQLLNSFNSMYRPHEAREDTVLFPALRKIISKNEYYALGEDFEDKEHELFGKDGFENMVGKVGEIEKQLGIYDLSKFTPLLQ